MRRAKRRARWSEYQRIRMGSRVRLFRVVEGQESLVVFYVVRCVVLGDVLVVRDVEEVLA